MRAIISFLVIACLILETPILILADTHAEDMFSSTYDPSREDKFYFRGHPLPECKYFLVTEIGLLHRWNDKTRRTAFDAGKWYLTGDVGFMVNVNKSKAVGGVFFLGGDSDGSRAGFGPRFRIWLKDHSGRPSSTRLDVTLGPLVLLSDDYLYPSKPGFMANVSLNFHDWIAITSRLEVIGYSTARYTYAYSTNKADTDIAFYTGVKGASYGALIGLGVFLAVSVLTESFDF